MQMDGGKEVSLHKIYVSISVLNKTFANMRQEPMFRVLAHIWCLGVWCGLFGDMRLFEAGEAGFCVRLG